MLLNIYSGTRQHHTHKQSDPARGNNNAKAEKPDIEVIF